MDAYGNKYFETTHTQCGELCSSIFLCCVPTWSRSRGSFLSMCLTAADRSRWVEYADPRNFDASMVPAEWHGWLHRTVDKTPTQARAPAPLKTVRVFAHSVHLPCPNAAWQVHSQIPAPTRPESYAASKGAALCASWGLQLRHSPPTAGRASGGQSACFLAVEAHVTHFVGSSAGEWSEPCTS